MALKIVVVPPIPMASVRTATSVKAGAFAKSASRVAEVLPQSFDPTRYGPDADHVKV